MTSIIAEIALQQNWNAFGILEGAPFQDERALFTNDFARPMFDTDLHPVSAPRPDLQILGFQTGRRERDRRVRDGGRIAGVVIRVALVTAEDHDVAGSRACTARRRPRARRCRARTSGTRACPACEGRPPSARPAATPCARGRGPAAARAGACGSRPGRAAATAARRRARKRAAWRGAASSSSSRTCSAAATLISTASVGFAATGLEVRPRRARNSGSLRDLLLRQPARFAHRLMLSARWSCLAHRLASRQHISADDDRLAGRATTLSGGTPCRSKDRER